ncbi:MAG: DM13 domain-containing protein [Nostocaceae cyanobacterium]|nr:DM13 domain-containing protein [Nostocaceae cyanobacterium]
MKLQYLTIASLATFLTIGCANEVTSKQPVTQTQPATIVSSPTVQVATTSTGGGNFQAGEHPTKGMVRVVSENGKKLLEFDQAFKTDNGPDLFVILHRSEAPPISGIKEKDYASIAKLQKTSGTQRYTIPDGVNIANFKSVAIWCRKFNATFGYAPLKM